MVLEMRRLLICMGASVALGSAAMAQRAPSVTYTATGSAGAWDLNFQLTNNFMAGEGDFYFLGVLLDTGRQIIATPTGYDSDKFHQWSNQSYGGSETMYNNIWLNLYSRPDDVVPSASKHGFIARSNSLVAPTSVPFFAFAAAGIYHGQSNYSNYWNPGFEGTAVLTTTSVPEPGAFAVLGIGLIALVRKRKK